ncbi:MAG: hypothetical protein ABW220_06250 [Burkholderiaceae bacterium]
MNKLFAFIAIAVTLTACSKTETTSAPAAVAPVAATSEAPAASTATPAAAPAVTTTAASADIPKECQDYLDKVNACVSKQPGASGDAIKAGMEQTKAAWASMGTDKAQLSVTCKAVSDAFAAQAAAMKC